MKSLATNSFSAFAICAMSAFVSAHASKENFVHSQLDVNMAAIGHVDHRTTSHSNVGKNRLPRKGPLAIVLDEPAANTTSAYHPKYKFILHRLQQAGLSPIRARKRQCSCLTPPRCREIAQECRGVQQSRDGKNQARPPVLPISSWRNGWL